jgi:endogenous inhibitor of DNA gyrase (YacG/DUF329 family)
MPNPACPVCAKPATDKFRPFCCARCADVDLGRWITGQYVVPGPDGEAAEAPLDMPEALR